MTIQSRHAIITPKPPFNFRHTLDFLGVFTPASGEQTLDEQTLRKAMQVRGHTVVFELVWNGAIDRPQLHSRMFSAQPLDDETVAAVIDRVSFYLSTDDDLAR